ncbi:MAG: hypothetical protein DRO23_00835 [Thermoprotei archaeon]|nr:MAG: hypothetical protein DRO23_00835 [Thermoprotei archaeon]
MVAVSLITHGDRDLAIEEHFVEVLYPSNILVRMKKTLLTPLDYYIILGRIKPKIPKPFILSSIGLGVIVDKGFNISSNVVGKYVLLGPTCNDKLFTYGISGLARTYVSVPINCVTILPSEYAVTEILAAPIVSKITNILKSLTTNAIVRFDHCLCDILTSVLSSLNIPFSRIGKSALKIKHVEEDIEKVEINISFKQLKDAKSAKVWNISCLSNATFNETVLEFFKTLNFRKTFMEIDVDHVNIEALKKLQEKLIVIVF